MTRLDPAPDPLAAFGAVRHLPYPLLLESAGPLTTHSRYTYVMADPVRLVRATAHPRALDELRPLLAAHRRERIPGLPPFQGGLAGYLTYELGASLEGITSDTDAPGILMGLYDRVTAWDRETGECWMMDAGRGTRDTGRVRAECRMPEAERQALSAQRSALSAESKYF